MTASCFLTGECLFEIFFFMLIALNVGFIFGWRLRK